MKKRKPKTVIIPNLRSTQPMRKLPFWGIVSLLLLLPTFHSHDSLLAAQRSQGKPYALIVGTVWGPDDLPVYGVTVKIRKATDRPKKVRWEVFSDHRGEFEQRLPAGEAEYIVWTDLKGYKPPDGKPLHLVKEVTVHIYNDERQDIGLHLEH
ncbi:MAG: carboxypeptidase-like regulatory domain-containing protein [Candidatus Sulfotelmatobacter sp.]